jgi:predicted small secreted protein
MKILIAFILAVNITACSTVAGVGKDLTSTAEWTKEKMK